MKALVTTEVKLDVKQFDYIQLAMLSAEQQKDPAIVKEYLRLSDQSVAHFLLAVDQTAKRIPVSEASLGHFNLMRELDIIPKGVFNLFDNQSSALGNADITKVSRDILEQIDWPNARLDRGDRNPGFDTLDEMSKLYDALGLDNPTLPTTAKKLKRVAEEASQRLEAIGFREEIIRDLFHRHADKLTVDPRLQHNREEAAKKILCPDIDRNVIDSLIRRKISGDKFDLNP